MSRSIHELPDWPDFQWDQEKLAGPLAALRHRQGRLIGRMETLGFSLRAEATLQTLTLDVLKSSEIEGEILNRDQVRSSIARRLGMDIRVGTCRPQRRGRRRNDAGRHAEIQCAADRRTVGRLACLAFPNGLQRY